LKKDRCCHEVRWNGLKWMTSKTLYRNGWLCEERRSSPGNFTVGLSQRKNEIRELNHWMRVRWYEQLLLSNREEHAGSLSRCHYVREIQVCDSSSELMAKAVRGILSRTCHIKIGRQFK
jgi:hypothetical protein